MFVWLYGCPPVPPHHVSIMSCSIFLTLLNYVNVQKNTSGHALNPVLAQERLLVWSLNKLILHFRQFTHKIYAVNIHDVDYLLMHTLLLKCILVIMERRIPLDSQAGVIFTHICFGKLKIIQEWNI